MSEAAPNPPIEEPEDSWMIMLRRNREAIERMRAALAEKDRPRVTPPGIPCE